MAAIETAPLATSAPLAPAKVARVDLVWGLLTYVVSRIIVVAGAAAVSAAKVAAAAECEFRELAQCPERPRSAATGILDALASWDGQWYISLVRDGYPRSVPTGITYFQEEARAAFFPIFPMLVRLFDKLLPGGDVAAALVLNLLLGALFVVLIGQLAASWIGPAQSRRVMLLAALYPGSFVLSFAYSEAAFLVLAAAAMLAFERRKFLLAGVIAAICTATRPNGLALIAAFVIASLLLIKQKRAWRSLWAPAIAPIGFVLTQLYIGSRANEGGVWFRVQNEAWGEGFSFGLTALRRTGKFFAHPLTSPSNLITVLSLLSLIIAAVALQRAKLPMVGIAFALAIIFLMLIPATVTARPRFVYSAFPLIIGVVRAWPRRWGDELWQMLMVLCGAALFGLSVLYGLYAVVIP